MNMTGHLTLAAMLALGFVLPAMPVQAADPPVVHLTIKGGRFVPDTLVVPANTRFKLLIRNDGPGPEEFESASLRKEKVLAEGVESFLIFQPLKPGTYTFFGEFHPQTAQGRMIAR